MPEYRIGDLSNDLRRIPVDLRKRLRPELARAAQPVLADAKRRAGWSSRIPAAISIKVLYGTRPGLWLRTSSRNAPHARPYEGAMGQRSFRHPVYGNRENWVTQVTRPFLFPAALEGMTDVSEAAGEALDSALRRAGFG